MLLAAAHGIANCVTEEQLQKRLKEIAQQIEADYKDQDLILVGVLKGAVMVMADLSRHINRHLDMDWMAVSSYGSGTKSSGVVRILKDLDKDITGRNVLIVEDIVDTGLSIDFIKKLLTPRNPASVRVVSLLRKRRTAKASVITNEDYIGFEIPDEFVIGYGLDYSQKLRNLRSIYRLSSRENKS